MKRTSRRLDSPLTERPPTPVTVGYARSAAGKSPVRQVNTLLRAGVAKHDIYVERPTGGKPAWPERDRLLPRLRRGDTLKVTRLDRLFYSVQSLIVLGTDLRNRGIRIQAVEQRIDSESLDGRDLFGMLAALAALHRQFVTANTNDRVPGIRAPTGGRSPKLNDEQIHELRRQHAAGISVPQLTQKFDVSQTTVYRFLRLADLERERPTT